MVNKTKKTKVKKEDKSTQIKKENKFTVSKEHLINMYKNMVKIRKYEEQIAVCVQKGEVKTPCHLYCGEEAIAVGVCEAMAKKDYLFSYYRGHGHWLARGGSGKELMAEVYCKETGCSGGRGGSMHLSDPKLGIIGNTAIVAGQIGLAAGAALKSKLMNTKQVSVVFFGDAATEEGIFFETINFAALHKLPVVFICENNDLAAHMRLKDRQPIKYMVQKTKEILPSICIIGNFAEEVYAIADIAIERARSGSGPTFIECITYRHKGHVGPNLDLDDVGKGLRTQEEWDSWKKLDPILMLQNRLVGGNILTTKQINLINKKYDKEVEQSLKFARESKQPNKETLLNHVYTEVQK